MHRCRMDMQTPPERGDIVLLPQQESDHVLKVLRMQTGDQVQLIAAGQLFACSIHSAADGQACLRVEEALPSPEPAVKIMLVQGLPKGDKLEWIVQKATELGVYSVLPVEMNRSVARITQKDEKKRARLSRIAMEAAKQSGRAHVPEILPSMRFRDAIKCFRGNIYVAWEEEASLRLFEAVQEDRPAELTIVIGPEGGISAEEISALKAAGAKPVTLGKRILRTETAGMCALTVAMTALGEI